MVLKKKAQPSGQGHLEIWLDRPLKRSQEPAEGRSGGWEKDTKYRRGKRKTSERYFHRNQNTTHLFISYFSSATPTHPLHIFPFFLSSQLSSSFLFHKNSIYIPNLYKACICAYVFCLFWSRRTMRAVGAVKAGSYIFLYSTRAGLSISNWNSCFLFHNHFHLGNSNSFSLLLCAEALSLRLYTCTVTVWENSSRS